MGTGNRLADGRGRYKLHANSVVAVDRDGRPLGVVAETATPFETPRLMGELVEWTNAGLASGASVVTRRMGYRRVS